MRRRATLTWPIECESGIRARSAPPSNVQTGTPSCLPARSSSAISTAALAGPHSIPGATSSIATTNRFRLAAGSTWGVFGAVIDALPSVDASYGGMGRL
eukprot:SAG11_NODE_1863_length_4154_cov_3.719359_3_plen_99_part_00